MKVTNIEWLSVEDREAAVAISDGVLDLVCFAQPFQLKIGDAVCFVIKTLDADHLQRTKESGFYAERVNGTFSHFISAKVESVEDRLVRLGILLIELDIPFPGDIAKGDSVSFSCKYLMLT